MIVVRRLVGARDRAHLQGGSSGSGPTNSLYGTHPLTCSAPPSRRHTVCSTAERVTALRAGCRRARDTGRLLPAAGRPWPRCSWLARRRGPRHRLASRSAPARQPRGLAVSSPLASKLTFVMASPPRWRRQRGAPPPSRPENIWRRYNIGYASTPAFASSDDGRRVFFHGALHDGDTPAPPARAGGTGGGQRGEAAAAAATPAAPPTVTV